MGRAAAGFTLIELLMALLVMSLVLVGAVGSFSTQNKAFIQQDLEVSAEENLRVGMNLVLDSLRDSAFGVPTTNLTQWFPWVSGFSSNPKITGTTLSVALCSLQPIATFSARMNSGATTLSLTSAVTNSQLSDLLDTNTKRLILINESENAQVKSVSSSSIQIDTDPQTAGNQGIKRSYPLGTPIYRIDVRTFSIQTDAAGMPYLAMNVNQGAGNQNVADGINYGNVTTVVAGTQYQVTLTARSQNIDPVSKDYLTRTLTSNVTVKN